jgi:1-deoxy-D-xylulose-5-phosphate synthase
MHSPPAFDPTTGKPLATSTTTWTHVFGREMVVAGAERPDVVAITAAMCGPTGLVPFATAFPDRAFDVGIAEQHAMTSAAGLAMGGMHPVVAVYATFLNRAFDQLLMDCALHRLGVTVVLDRAGVTGEDGPSHHGMWDMSLAAIVPGLRLAAPRDAVTLAEELAEALRVADGPTVLRFPKGAVPPSVPALRRFRVTRVALNHLSGDHESSAEITGGVDILAEPPAGQDRDVLLVAVGAFGGLAVEAATRLAAQGIGVTVVDPRWVLPVPSELSILAADHRLVVTVEDGGRSGGVGAAVTDRLARSGIPVQVLAIPQEFLEPGPRAELLADLGLTAQAVARGITEEIARNFSDSAAQSASRVAGDRDPGIAD